MTNEEDEQEQIGDDALVNLTAIKITLGQYCHELERNDFGETFKRLHAFFSRVRDDIDTLDEDAELAELDSLAGWTEAEQREIDELVRD